ncbi:hypothetical protein DQP55_24720 [Mycolicibacterium sp. GF69]|nr:hypothetical protein DQP55_24720 [Mycolicibacterium sp. GF69]
MMKKITGPVNRAKVEALTTDWANDPSTTVEIVHPEFNGDQRSGGFAFLCDRGLLICGYDGGIMWSLDPGDDASRLAKVEQYWRQSQHRNRALELDDVSPWHRAAITALVSGLRSVSDIPLAARPDLTDTARADALLIMLRRKVTEPTEAAALRALARNDWLLNAPEDGEVAHPCPVCGSPAVGRPWRYFSVCDDCYSTTVCADGRNVVGYNTAGWGGFEAMHVDDRSICEQVSGTGLAWVDGRKCRMGEAKFGGVFVAVSPPREFRDDDESYLAWIADHPGGWVVNIARNYNAVTARVHHAGCRTIIGKNPAAGVWTGPYIKVCSDHVDELEEWAISHTGASIPLCGTCHPADNTLRSKSSKPIEQRVAPAMSDARWEIQGPAGRSAVVEAWADDYIRFERLPDWQKNLREEIRRRCRQLEPSDGQVLHATYFGAKLPNADVENVVLYYIDSFRVAGRNGIRFEHGDAVPQAPDGAEYPFCYRYALAPRSGEFAHWRQGRTLTSFDWIDLGAFVGEKKLAQTWRALARECAREHSRVTVCEPAIPEKPFAVRVQVRPPQGIQPVWGGLVKGIVDGVVCAFQAQTDTTDIAEITTRLARMLGADPEEIEAYLLDQRCAVLGTVSRLVSIYGKGVKWDPADHLCVAGEVLAAEPEDDRWAIKGDVVEIDR